MNIAPILSFTLLLCTAAIAHSQTYSVDHILPFPTGEQLNDVCFADDNRIFAAGKNGIVLKISVPANEVCKSQLSAYDLNTVSFMNKYSGIVAGNNGVILRTTNSGAKWEAAKSGVSLNLHGSSVTPDGRFFVCGLSGIVLTSTDNGRSWIKPGKSLSDPLFCIDFTDQYRGSIGSFNSVYLTSSSGTQWSKSSFNFQPSAQITGICIVDSATVYACSSPPQGRFIKTTDFGITWSAISLNLPYLFGGTVDLVRDMFFTDKLCGKIITDFGTILSTSDSGVTWSVDTTSRPGYLKTSVMKAISYRSGNYAVCGGGGTVRMKANDAGSWTVLSGGLKSVASAVFINSTTGFTSGEGNEVFKTIDAGSSWNKFSTHPSYFGNSICFENEYKGFVGGSTGIYKTTSSGLSWSYSFTGPVKFNKIIRGTSLLAGGGIEHNGHSRILKSTNSGETWTTLYSGSAGIVTDIAMSGSDTLAAVTNQGKVLVSSDGGETWNINSTSIPFAKCIDISPAKETFIGSSNGLLLRSTDLGRNWSILFTGQYRTINDLSIIGERIFIVGSSGYAGYSNDCGDSWQSVASGTTNDLNQICLMSKDTALIFGEYGTILRLALQPSMITGEQQLATTKSSGVTFSSPNNRINILLPAMVKSINRVELFDLSGRSITFRYDLSEMKLRILPYKSLSKGIYLVRISDKSGSNYIRRILYMGY